MIDLSKEAEEYAAIPSTLSLTTRQKIQIAYVAGATDSKYVQAKIIQAQIDVLLKHQQKLGGYEPITGALKQQIQIDIYELQQQLKQLENEYNIRNIN